MSTKTNSKYFLQSDNQILSGYLLLLLLSVFGFVALEQPLILAIPIATAFAFLAIHNVYAVFLVFFVTLPFTIEYYLPNGLGTDLPAEPLMLFLTGISFLVLIKRIEQVKKHVLTHPITFCLLIHLLWVFCSALYSEQSIVSLKFFLAKLWYVIPFYFLAPYIIDDQKKILFTIRLILLALVFSILIVLLRHASVGFSFKDVHYAVRIFYRNHVNYACLLAVFVPFLLLWCKYEFRNSVIDWFKYPLILLFMVALYLSFTRAAMIAAFLVIPVYFIIRFRLMKWIISFAFAVALGLIAFLSFENKYLAFAPDYNKTITHHKFDNLLEATVKLEDISTMERVYRWVAGAHMLSEKPYLGFGPGNFYFFYKKYTVSSFKTYVSDNPEKSGMHNYYMMTLVEQGVIGILLFLLLPICALLYGESLFHRLGHGFDQDLLLTAMMMLCIILAINFMNDMLETAKQGPFFFWSLAIITSIGIKSKLKVIQ